MSLTGSAAPPPPPAACCARLPAAPSAPTATQSPWRLPYAGLAGVDSPIALAARLAVLAARGGLGSHTPRIADAGGTFGTFGLRFSAQYPPPCVSVLLDRTYVAPIHASPHAHGTDMAANVVHQYTDRYTPPAPPIHDRHTARSRQPRDPGAAVPHRNTSPSSRH